MRKKINKTFLLSLSTFVGSERFDVPSKGLVDVGRSYCVDSESFDVPSKWLVDVGRSYFVGSVQFDVPSKWLVGRGTEIIIIIYMYIQYV